MAKVLIFQHVPDETPGTIEEFLYQESIPFLIWKPNGAEQILDELNVDDFSHLVVLGGFMGVYEASQYPFLTWEMMFMEKFAARGGKILGICLGAQMLAHILGGRVYKGLWGEEIGWHTIHPTQAGLKDPIFSTLFDDRDSLLAFQWHGDTFDLPDGAYLLAYTDTYPHQAFSVESRLYGLQFHIEVNPNMIRRWFPDKPEWWQPAGVWKKLNKKAYRFYRAFFGK
ncbi:MAG: type 1 glutamine amidotransferase [Thermodesulforhabdaceae bacterium]|jgi:GMP synthase-like glutamine amidotransferase